jgi:large subunit ribosomal protein L9
MKVILTAEVKGKGHEGDVVEVARGYAVNYLLPRKMAVAATSGNVKQLQARMSNINKRNDARRTDAEGIAQSIRGKTVAIEAKAGDEGKLFGSVTTLMIEEAIAAQLGRDVDHRRMDLTKAIKVIGDHPVVVSVFGDIKAELNVRVVREGAGAEAVASAAAPAVSEPEAQVSDGSSASDAAPATEAVAESEDTVADDAEPASDTAGEGA